MAAHLVSVDDVVAVAEAGAPIVLLTGLPGAGKSLFALAEFAVGKQSVYQAGVPGCVLPAWKPEEWQDMPAGSTLIVDEAQEFFAPKPPTSEPPSHYVLNKIRHKALCLVLITQHPSMLDARVRRLVGRHIHLVAAFGKDAAVTHEWNKCGDVDAPGYPDSSRGGFKYPKEVYKLYKSADAHRPKQKAPFKVRVIPYLFVLVVALMGLGAWFVYSRMGALAHGDVVRAAQPGGKGLVGAATRPGGAGAAPAMSSAEYVASFSPRVPGLAYSAPRYDAVTKPVRAPFPAACISTSTRCSCYSQQGTPLQVEAGMCRAIVAGGFFKDFDDVDSQKADAARPAVPGPASVQPGAPGVGGVVAVPAGPAPVAPGAPAAAVTPAPRVAVGRVLGAGGA